MDDARSSTSGGLSPEMMLLIGGGIAFAAYAFKKVAEETGKKHVQESVKQEVDAKWQEAKKELEDLFDF